MRQKNENRILLQKNGQLIALNNKKKKIIGIATHDLSTPLASIDMWNQLLKNSGNDWNEDQTRSFEMIHEGVAYGQRLLKKMVDLESLIPDKINIDNFDFGSFAKAIVENIGSNPTNSIRWNIKIAKPIFLFSDMALIKKMCEAILMNAVNTSKVNGELYVYLEKENDEIIFLVKNETTDLQKLPGLFSDYKQLAADKNGSGELSKLAIAQRITEELNGIITLENKNGFTIVMTKFKTE